MGAVSVVSIACHLTNGFPQRISAEARALLAYSNDRPVAFFDCEYKPADRNPQTCLVGSTEGSARVAIVGDNHAQALAGAIEFWLREKNQSGRLWFHHGCRPVLGSGPETCREFVDAAMDEIIANPAITHVLFVSAWHHDPGLYNGQFFVGPDADAAFSNVVEATLDKFDNSDQKLFLVDPVFAATARVPERMAKNLVFNRNLPLSQS